MARTTQRSQAEDAAAKQQELANADRNRQDAEEREILTRLFLAQRRRDEAAKNLASAEHDMAHEVEALFRMGNSVERVVILIGETDKETIRRLRRLAKPNTTSTVETSPTR